MGAFERAVPYRAAIWIDVDHMHALNDRVGFAAGDRAIAEIARALRDVAGDEYTYRASGDEFLVALPAGWDGDVTALGERIRDAVEAAGVGLTVSVGVPDAASGSESGPLIDRAEDCQQHAKARGRNAVSDRSP
jgi:two-component system, cell cycle response regulator